MLPNHSSPRSQPTASHFKMPSVTQSIDSEFRSWVTPALPHLHSPRSSPSNQTSSPTSTTDGTPSPLHDSTCESVDRHQNQRRHQCRRHTLNPTHQSSTSPPHTPPHPIAPRPQATRAPSRSPISPQPIHHLAEISTPRPSPTPASSTSPTPTSSPAAASTRCTAGTATSSFSASLPTSAPILARGMVENFFFEIDHYGAHPQRQPHLLPHPLAAALPYVHDPRALRAPCSKPAHERLARTRLQLSPTATTTSGSRTSSRRRHRPRALLRRRPRPRS